jgi:hypothetical protein
MIKEVASPSIRELGLPSPVGRRFCRHLKGVLRNRGEAHPQLRRVVRDATAHLLLGGTAAEDVPLRLREAAEGFVREGGLERVTIITGAPMYAALYATVERWARESVHQGGREPRRRGGGVPRLIAWRRSIGV